LFLGVFVLVFLFSFGVSAEVIVYLAESSSCSRGESAPTLLAGETRTFYLCMDSGNIPSTELPCEAGDGDEVCFWDIYLHTRGVAIEDFVPEPGVLWRMTPNGGLVANGGDPIDGELGIQPLGVLTVRGLMAGGITTVNSYYADASILRREIPNQDILVTIVPIIGSSGNDKLDGGRGDDVIQGMEGDDVIQGGPGDDFIDGGPGEDVAYFSGERSRYQVVMVDGGVTIVMDSLGSDGEDQLVNVEFIHFSDAILRLQGTKWIPVPEPEAGTLCAAALACLAFLSRRRRRRAQ